MKSNELSEIFTSATEMFTSGMSMSQVYYLSIGCYTMCVCVSVYVKCCYSLNSDNNTDILRVCEHSRTTPNSTG